MNRRGHRLATRDEGAPRPRPTGPRDHHDEEMVGPPRGQRLTPALSAIAAATSPATMRNTATTVCVIDSGCRISGI